MCGIWAVFGSEVDVRAQSRAMQTVQHRGPDAFRLESLSQLRNCCLGFHRLAVVDPVLGMQPMRLHGHPHVWLVCNGEVYNHKLLTETYHLDVVTGSDVEPLIPLYGQLGPAAMLGQLDGVFALCLLDTAARRVVLATDTFGVRPLFRLTTPTGMLAVCSEAKGLLSLVPGSQPELLCPGRVEVYDLDLEGRAVLASSTPFTSPGQPPLYTTLVTPHATDTKQNVRRLLEAAVRKRMMSERRIGCLLSGGLDSSLVAALLVKQRQEMGVTSPLQTFAVGMAGSPDLQAARKVSEYLKTEHHEIIFEPQEGYDVIPDVIRHMESYEVCTVRGAVAMYLLSRYIRQFTDSRVVMAGEGSDEVTQGYLHFHHAPSAEDADRESRRLLQQLQVYDVLRIDRTTAAWGLEVRVPFLDHQFSSYYLSLPPEERQPQGGVEKHLLRAAFEDEHLLPEHILWRPKTCLSDGISATHRTWRQCVHEYVDKLIDDEELMAAQAVWPHNPPATKEALYYRRTFQDSFPSHSAWVPSPWVDSHYVVTLPPGTGRNEVKK